MLVPVLAGTDAFAHLAAKICDADYDVVEQKRVESFPYEHENQKKRNASILLWAETASQAEITKIWGEPSVYEGFHWWRVPLEYGVVISEINQEGNKYCFYISPEAYAIRLVDKINAEDLSQRRVEKVVR